MAFLKTPGHGFTPMGCLWAPVWGNSGPFRLGAFGPCAAAPWGPVEGGRIRALGVLAFTGVPFWPPPFFSLGPMGVGGLHSTGACTQYATLGGSGRKHRVGRKSPIHQKKRVLPWEKKGASPMAKGDSWRGGSGF
jgi:hypothetical protein